MASRSSTRGLGSGPFLGGLGRHPNTPAEFFEQHDRAAQIQALNDQMQGLQETMATLHTMMEQLTIMQDIA